MAKSKTDEDKKKMLMSGVLTFEMAAVTAGANGSSQWLVVKEDRMKFGKEKILKAAEALSKVAAVLKAGAPTGAVATKLDADVEATVSDLAADLPAL